MTNERKLKIMRLNKNIVKESNEQEAKPKSKKKIIISIVVITIILISVIAYLFFAKDNSNLPAFGGESKVETVEEDNQAPSIIIDGFTTANVTEKNPYIWLANPSENNVYFEYHIFDENGTEIFVSDYLPPEEDKGVNFEPRKYLDKGERVLTFTINTYAIDSLEARNGSSFQATVTIN